jgi:hypothetical protein
MKCLLSVEMIVFSKMKAIEKYISNVKSLKLTDCYEALEIFNVLLYDINKKITKKNTRM